MYSKIVSPNKTQHCNILHCGVQLNIITNSFRLIKDFILWFLLMTTWKYLMYIIYTFMIYYIIKIPINNFIYTSISLYIIAFLFALLSSWFISILAKELFKYLFKNIESYEYILSRYVLDSLTCLVIDYFPSLVYIVPIAPRYGPNVQAVRLQRNDYLVRKGNIIYSRIRRLEPVVSAIGSDGTDPRHPPLCQVLTSHIIDSKNELSAIKKEIWINNLYVPYNGRDFIFIARYWEEVIGFQFFNKL